MGVRNEKERDNIVTVSFIGIEKENATVRVDCNFCDAHIIIELGDKHPYEIGNLIREKKWKSINGTYLNKNVCPKCLINDGWIDKAEKATRLSEAERDVQRAEAFNEGWKESDACKRAVGDMEKVKQEKCKKLIEKENQKLVYLQWQDAHASVGWFDEEDLKEKIQRAMWIVEEVGWIVYEDENEIHMVGRRGLWTKEEAMEYGLYQRIPKGWIIKRKEMEIF